MPLNKNFTVFYQLEAGMGASTIPSLSSKHNCLENTTLT